VNNLSHVSEKIRSFGLDTFPMISSYPYPPQFLDWMRELFKNPGPFLKVATEEILKNDFTGYNVDWEPNTEATQEDAINYANFLSQFATTLHKIHKKLNVDIASWNTVWDWNLLSQSKVDNLFLMNTYTGNFDEFKKSLEEAVEEIDILKLGIGLETINEDNHNQPFTDAELKQRFKLIEQYHIQEIDIWRSAIPNNWWPFIDSFLKS